MLNMLFPETPLQLGKSEEIDHLLTEVQGNVLSPHRREFSAHLFFAIPPENVNRLKVWLRSLAESNQITSMHRQIAGLAGNQLFLSAMVSYLGAERLGWGDQHIFRRDFRVGMHGREETLVIEKDDPSVAGVEFWQENFRVGAPPQAKRIELYLMLAADEAATLRVETDKIRQEAEVAGAQILAPIEEGYIFRNEQNRAIEHFGFADDISNPVFLEDDLTRRAGRRRDQSSWNPLFPLETVLVPVKGSTGLSSYGSFFVFRKIEQHVAAFRAFERRLASEISSTGNDIVGDPGAWIVGRQRNGHPLVMEDREGAPIAPSNDFTYQKDRAGARCPFHAHVRKSNPRRFVAEDNDDARAHLFPRRGMLYGSRAADFADEPEGGVGLLFMAYMANIEQQFEHVLRNWINNPKFPGKEQPGTDPLIGEPPPKTAVLPLSSKCSLKVELDRFVTTRGGEYFFVPPVSWFRTLEIGKS